MTRTSCKFEVKVSFFSRLEPFANNLHAFISSSLPGVIREDTTLSHVAKHITYNRDIRYSLIHNAIYSDNMRIPQAICTFLDRRRRITVLPRALFVPICHTLVITYAMPN